MSLCTNSRRGGCAGAPVCPCDVFVHVHVHVSAMSLSHGMSCRCPRTCPGRVLPPLFSPRVFVRCLRNCPHTCPRTCPCLYTRPNVVHLVSFPMSVSCPCRIPDPAYVLSMSMYCPVHVLAQFTAHLQLVSIIFHVARELAAERSLVTGFRLLGFGGVGRARICVCMGTKCNGRCSGRGSRQYSSKWWYNCFGYEM